MTSPLLSTPPISPGDGLETSVTTCWFTRRSHGSNPNINLVAEARVSTDPRDEVTFHVYSMQNMGVMFPVRQASFDHQERGIDVEGAVVTIGAGTVPMLGV